MLESAAHPGRKLIRANPANGVKLLKSGKRERFVSEAELAGLADALIAMEVEHRLSSTATAAIRLLLLSGCRKSEILSLRWGWVDIERGVLRLPDSKTGAKAVPLAAAAVKLLAELPRRGDCVLPAAKGTATTWGCRRIGSGVRARAGLNGVRIHDLRHSFASFAVADGNSLYLIGKVLGHKQARTTEIYAHLADNPIRAVADRTAARIAAAMASGAERDPAAPNVVSLRGARP
jgi:integrase